MEKQFFLPMIPPTVTHQMKKVRVVNGKPVHYEPARLAATRSKFMACLGQHKPTRKLRGPVRLMVKWCFPVKSKHGDGEWKITKPDTDNLQKLLKDCMTAVGFWKDDAQVCSEIIEKFWSAVPGIFISVAELEVQDDD
ncbi:MAG: RusA family crossover junction endodeoxyribonuclease [Oscillospiraceae bacterium]|nr:RusA family crossover junction endodeoxyribonuclease [Oscillospiraceae bacterium]